MINDSSTKKRDMIIQHGEWEFNQDVSFCFDDMLSRSIAGYDRMRDIVYRFGESFIREGTYIIDIGCSNGNAIMPFVRRSTGNCKFCGVEISDAMVKTFRERFSKEIEDGIVSICNADIRTFYPNVQASLVLSILTIQFVEPALRQGIINRVYESLIPGGAFIFVEKTKCDNPEFEKLVEQVYYDYKRAMGYTEEQIYAKKTSLEGVLQPLSCNENILLLQKSGFQTVACIWSDITFSGWIAVKE